MRTTRILEKSLDEKNFQILRDRRFNCERYPELKQVYESPHTYVFYPSESAISLDEFKTLIQQATRDAVENSSSSQCLDKSDDNNNTNNHDKTTSHQADVFHLILIDGNFRLLTQF